MMFSEYWKQNFIISSSSRVKSHGAWLKTAADALDVPLDDEMYPN